MDLASFNREELKYRSLDEAMERAIDDMIREENLVIENLTRIQVGEVLRQVFACGDIQRLVYVDVKRQAVTYLPYRREQELLDKIKELRDKLLAVTGENHL